MQNLDRAVSLKDRDVLSDGLTALSVGVNGCDIREKQTIIDKKKKSSSLMGMCQQQDSKNVRYTHF